MATSTTLISTLAAASSRVPTKPTIQNIAVNPAAKKNCWIDAGTDSLRMVIIVARRGSLTRNPLTRARRHPSQKYVTTPT